MPPRKRPVKSEATGAMEAVPKRYDEDDLDTPAPKSRLSKESKIDENKIKIMERNRAAATRCRERKKQWRQELLQRERVLEESNSQLRDELKKLREEIACMRNAVCSTKGPQALIEAGIELSEYSDPTFDIDAMFTATRSRNEIEKQNNTDHQGGPIKGETVSSQAMAVDNEKLVPLPQSNSSNFMLS
eukprot:gene8328-874_t